MQHSPRQPVLIHCGGGCLLGQDMASRSPTSERQEPATGCAARQGRITFAAEMTKPWRFSPGPVRKDDEGILNRTHRDASGPGSQLPGQTLGPLSVPLATWLLAPKPGWATCSTHAPSWFSIACKVAHEGTPALYAINVGINPNSPDKYPVRDELLQHEGKAALAALHDRDFGLWLRFGSDLRQRGHSPFRKWQIGIGWDYGISPCSPGPNAIVLWDESMIVLAKFPGQSAPDMVICFVLSWRKAALPCIH